MSESSQPSAMSHRCRVQPARCSGPRPERIRRRCWLTEKQQIKLAWVVHTNPALGRAYYLKEGLRLVFKLPRDEAAEALDKWISWARRCRIPSFVKLQRSIVKHRAAILASIEHGLSNGRIESMNTKIRLLTRIAFGFKSPDALIALAMLSLGGHKPALPAGINPRLRQESRDSARIGPENSEKAVVNENLRRIGSPPDRALRLRGTLPGRCSRLTDRERHNRSIRTRFSNARCG